MPSKIWTQLSCFWKLIIDKWRLYTERTNFLEQSPDQRGCRWNSCKPKKTSGKSRASFFVNMWYLKMLLWQAASSWQGDHKKPGTTRKNSEMNSDTQWFLNSFKSDTQYIEKYGKCAFPMTRRLAQFGPSAGQCESAWTLGCALDPKTFWHYLRTAKPWQSREAMERYDKTNVRVKGCGRHWTILVRRMGWYPTL